MKKYDGKVVCKGIALGQAFVIKPENQMIKREKIENTAEEIEKVKGAIEKAVAQLGELYEKAINEIGEAEAGIFEVHQMLIEDEDYQSSIFNMIETEKVCAPFATSQTGDQFASIFSAMDDEYMQARSADILDITARIVRILLGQESVSLDNVDKAVIIADDLTPSQTVQLDKNKVVAFVTVHGSANSHTAILARTMNIPALIGVDIDLEAVQPGAQAIVDGLTGELVLDPDEEAMSNAMAKIKEKEERETLLLEQKGMPTVTKDGRKVNLYANIGNVSDLGYVLENDAEGIGLFRSEFLYIGKSELPSEEEQFLAYKKVAQTMGGKKVIIRTLDIGADKKADYLGLDEEENPALGYRAIRICLTRPEIFKTQLRALFRAAAYGNLSIMYPMIISDTELDRIEEIVEQVKAELDAESLPYKVPEQGIMIETPAAAIISDVLAKRVDFFSIGTNDLTQYTLALDRQNQQLDYLLDTHHTAILRLIEMTVANAHKEGIWVGICGELGADMSLTEQFVNMGVDELSVAPPMVLPLRKTIREI